ncbi:hypothetical protein [Carnobacterium sp. FSL W8-0810]|uniref:hypothetical protein n=1 Tax=Carnobacterium sp. FSL W8-0810 TaxID=2954705 RepID=UPI0030FC7735
MRNPTVQPHTTKKNATHPRLNSVALFGLALLLLIYILRPAYTRILDDVISTYRTTFPSEQMEKKDSLKVIGDSASSEKEIVEEAKALKQEKHQEVTILTYYDSNLPSEESNSARQIKYKAETTDKGVKIKNFYSNKSVAPDTTLSSQWDVSENTFDLVSGVLRIELIIEEKLSPESIIAQSRGLIELLMAYNAEKEIHSIELEMKSGKENYSFDSKEIDTLVSTKMVYTN